MVMNTDEIANRLIERNGISMWENKEHLKELVYEHPKEALRELYNRRMFYMYSIMNDNYNRLKAKEGNVENLPVYGLNPQGYQTSDIVAYNVQTFITVSSADVYKIDNSSKKYLST